MSAAKKAKVDCKFRPDYTQTWNFIVSSKSGDTFARCTVCCADFSVKSGGRYDVERHIKGKKHQDKATASASSVPVSTFFKQSTAHEDAVTKAELGLTAFFTEHNLPLSAMDHLTGLLKNIFPDSKIAQDVKCGRSKATELVKTVSADRTAKLVHKMKARPFSLSTDGSNDSGAGQMYPIVVKTFDDDYGEVVTELLCLATCDGASTGENIFKILDGELERREIPWENCIGFSCDNASVMTGVHKGVSSHILKRNEAVYVNGCPCHLQHIAAKKGSQSLRLDIEEILVDIYFYLDKSSKRKKDFQRFQAEAGTNLHAILKHGPTRWLSLNSCIIRLLEQWEPLKAYFASEFSMLKESQRDSLRNTRVTRVNNFFSSVTSKLYCLFLKENLPIFINANLQLQTEAPQIHKMLQRLDEVVADLLVRFVKPEAIMAAPTIFKVAFREHANQKKRQDLLLGESVRKHLEELKRGNLISAEQQDSFSRDVRAFFSEATGYILEKFPLKDKVLHNLQVLDIQKRQSTTVSMIKILSERFPCLLDQNEKETVDIEFAKFQIETLPTAILQAERVDRQWHMVSQIKMEDGTFKYPSLSKLMKGLCCLPHSNADAERVFSMVRKNQTVFRSSLTIQTLSALLIQKVEMASTGVPCFKQQFSTGLLAKARRAYALSLKGN